MTRLKAWVLRWLGAVSVEDYPGNRAGVITSLREEFTAALAATKADHETAIANLKAEHDAATADLISELNVLRNSIPAAAIQQQKPAVRVLRNFGDFKAAVERRPVAHRIERTS